MKENISYGDDAMTIHEYGADREKVIVLIHPSHLCNQYLSASDGNCFGTWNYPAAQITACTISSLVIKTSLLPTHV